MPSSHLTCDGYPARIVRQAAVVRFSYGFTGTVASTIFVEPAWRERDLVVFGWLVVLGLTAL